MGARSGATASANGVRRHGKRGAPGLAEAGAWEVGLVGTGHVRSQLVGCGTATLSNERQWRSTSDDSGRPRASGRQDAKSRAWTAVTPHVSKPHDYVNHMFMRP
jgi:hypothetical protein